MYRGYVKLWRKAIDSGLFGHPLAWTIWCWILINATYKRIKYPTRHGIVELEPGQVIVGRYKMAKIFGTTEQKLRTAILLLKSTSTITIKTTNRYSLITVINWTQYQTNEDEITSTITNTLTSSQPAANQQLTTDKECKNERSKENPLVGEGAATPQKPKSKPKDAFSPDLEAIYAAYPSRRGDGASTGKSLSDKERLQKRMAELPDYPFLDAIAFHRKTATKEMYKNFTAFLNNLPDADEVRGALKPDKPIHVCKPKIQARVFDEALKDFVDPPPRCACGKLLGDG